MLLFARVGAFTNHIAERRTLAIVYLDPGGMSDVWQVIAGQTHLIFSKNGSAKKIIV